MSDNTEPRKTIDEMIADHEAMIEAEYTECPVCAQREHEPASPPSGGVEVYDARLAVIDKFSVATPDDLPLELTAGFVSALDAFAAAVRAEAVASANEAADSQMKALGLPEVIDGTGLEGKIMAISMACARNHCAANDWKAEAVRREQQAAPWQSTPTVAEIEAHEMTHRSRTGLGMGGLWLRSTENTYTPATALLKAFGDEPCQYDADSESWISIEGETRFQWLPLQPNGLPVGYTPPIPVEAAPPADLTMLTHAELMDMAVALEIKRRAIERERCRRGQEYFDLESIVGIWNLPETGDKHIRRLRDDSAVEAAPAGEVTDA